MAAKRVGDASWRDEVGAAGPDPQRRRASLEAARLRYGSLSAAGKKKLLDELAAHRLPPQVTAAPAEPAPLTNARWGGCDGGEE